jgi:hypothetical protein
VDNENGQTVYYLTLNENSTDLNFDLVNIKNYAKLQMTEDIKQRTLDILSVNGDGTGLIRMRQNQTGTLERFSLDVLIAAILPPLPPPASELLVSPPLLSIRPNPLNMVEDVA